MELAIILWLVRRWLWLLALGAIVVGGVNYIQSRLTPVQYEASTLLQIGTALQEIDPEFNFSALSAQLAQDYSAMLKTLPVLEDIKANLHLSISPDALSKTFTATIMDRTTFLVINVRYPDPITAADIANELAKQLIAISPTDLSNEMSSDLDNLIDENERVKTQLRSQRETLAIVEQELGTTISEERREELETRRRQLEINIAKTEGNLAAYSNIIVKLQQQSRRNVIEILTPARIPTAPIPDSGLSRILSGGFIGLILAGGIAYLYEYVTDTVREPIEITTQMKASVLASVPPFGRKGTYQDKLVAWSEPNSIYAEAYRTLRMNLTIRTESIDGQPEQRAIFVVTSPSPSEGKSVTAANLAVTLANIGFRVLLVDADLRRPTQHRIFGVPNKVGLSDLLSNTTLWRTIAQAETSMTHQDSTASPALVAQIKLFASSVTIKTGLPRLEIITSGGLPPNPVELLGSAQLQKLTEVLAASDQHDVVIFDTAPALHVVDSLVLAHSTSAEVIVVIEANKTRFYAAVNVLRQFEELHIPVAGMVLNRLKPRDVSNYAVYTSHMLEPYEEDDYEEVVDSADHL